MPHHITTKATQDKSSQDKAEHMDIYGWQQMEQLKLRRLDDRIHCKTLWKIHRNL